MSVEEDNRTRLLAEAAMYIMRDGKSRTTTEISKIIRNDYKLPDSLYTDFMTKQGKRRSPTLSKNINHAINKLREGDAYGYIEPLIEYVVPGNKRGKMIITDAGKNCELGKEKPEIDIDRLRKSLEKYSSDNVVKTAKIYNKILQNIGNHKNIILYGPPGTGKTYLTKACAMSIIFGEKTLKMENDEFEGKYKELVKSKHIRFITFHQSLTYEQFIEGIMPVIHQSGKSEPPVSSDIQYELRSGIFKELCEDANKDKKQKYILIIDEINRGNVSRIFGELITLIEENKRDGSEDSIEAILPYSKEPFSVPPNVYILGTMNTADRSLVSLDTALRRRFYFFEMPPNSKCVPETLEDVSLRSLMDILNIRITALYDQDHCLGHAYFIGIESLNDLMDAFRMKIIPQLQEYFHDDYEKIKLVLSYANDNDKSDFIVEKDINDAFINKSLIINKSYSVIIPDKADAYISLYRGKNKTDENDSKSVDDS